MKWFLLALGLGLSTLALADEGGRSWWHVWDAVDQTAGVSNRLFTTDEQRVLRDYLRASGVRGQDDWREPAEYKHKNKQKKQKPLPPGLQKKLARGGQLPPGWQKKMQRGEVLDGGLYAASRSLPYSVSGRLRQYEGTSVRQVEDRVVRIIDATGVILDVLSGR